MKKEPKIEEEVIKEEVNPPARPKDRISIDRQLSFKVFLISHLVIFLIGVLFISFCGWLLYGGGDKLSSEKYNPVTREPISFNLEINNPVDNLLIFESSVVISGKTDPLSTVLITQNETTTGLEADSKGNFTQVITLTPGVNNISITAFDTQGSTKSVTRTIYYSEEKI